MRKILPGNDSGVTAHSTTSSAKDVRDEMLDFVTYFVT